MFLGSMGKVVRKLLLMLFFTIIFNSCFPDRILNSTNIRLKDQAFKTALAVIELHKIRYGLYPESLDEVQFLGDWDKAMPYYVEYKLLENGYELNIIGDTKYFKRSDYPSDFWSGLGLQKSNLLKMGD